MARPIYIAIVIVLLFLVASCGCGEKGGFPLSNQTKPKTTTPTPVPTPLIGNLFITSSPIGAKVYLENQYKGVAPINITDLPNGKYNVSLRLDGYATNNFTAEVKGGQTTKITKSMSEAKAKVDITLTNTSLQRIPPCIWTFMGTVKNTGDMTIYDLRVTLSMKPVSSAFKVVTKELAYGDVDAGSVRPFGFDITVLCEGDYKPEWKWEGIDINNPTNSTDDKKVSGTIKF